MKLWNVLLIVRDVRIYLVCVKLLIYFIIDWKVDLWLKEYKMFRDLNHYNSYE